jgi:tRNA 2-thiouridine synthesizing protein A
MPDIMTLDFRGLKCPQPSLKLNAFWMKEKPAAGIIVDILADCPTFPNDLKNWATAAKKVIMFIKDENGYKKARIQF